MDGCSTQIIKASLVKVVVNSISLVIEEESYACLKRYPRFQFTVVICLFAVLFVQLLIRHQCFYYYEKMCFFLNLKNLA